MRFVNNENTSDGELKADSEYRKIKYQYIMRNQYNNKEAIEREPRRELRICDPNLYRGQLGL